MRSFRINFSMISKRTKAVAMQMTSYSTHLIQLIIGEELEVWVHEPKYMTACYYMFTSKEEMNGKGEENTWDGWNQLFVWKYSDNLIEEWQQLCKYVMELFKKQTIDILSMTLDTLVENNVSIIDFLKTNWKSVDICNLFQSEDKNDVDEHAAYLLNNLKVNYELYSYLDIKNVNFDMKIPKNLKELHIENSQWVGYERLLEIDCKNVILEKNRIFNKEWNLFLKKWIAVETHSNLEYLALILHDIPHEVVDGEAKITINGYLNRNIEINGGIDIRRVDGKTATFFVFQMEFLAMSVH
ncbi:hypothetical protein CRE_03567 [Caenorhabditis remanei]|uniref:Sdz-33 F-box domain-containing protein n=1 Tax=Caenorhabditis remanei TaxID=31234 RepID=E3NSC6_CAERE|nr:hypothetical protein CRE_03567 [Caenorhabditis remanei]